MVSSSMKSACLMTFGSILVVAGAVMVVFWPTIFFSQLKQMMILTNESRSFSIWREVPIPTYLEIHLFNITNVDEIMSGKNVTLKVQEMGPYVYREYITKENITWNDNGTVTFYDKKVWHFEPEMSNGSLSDLVTNVNPIVVSAAYASRHWNVAMRVTLDVFMKMYYEHLFLTANATSWLFDGIDDPLIDLAKRFPELPIEMPFDKFGWFYARNESLEFDGRFNMDTGANDFSQLGNILKWNYSNRTRYRDECGVVQGSGGELWAPELGQPEVAIFAPDLCSHIVLAKNESTTVLGIDGVTYAANDSMFDNGYRYPSMACYCDTVRDENCMPPGALNVSLCRYGAPAMVTRPHFLRMDPHYAKKVDGLSPTDDMNMRITLEMFTGMPLNVAAQLQINLLVRHVGGVTLNNHLPDPDVLVPMLWFRQELNVTPEYADLARMALTLRYKIPYIFYGLTVIGVLVLVVGVYIIVRKLLKSPETTPILEETVNENQ